MNRSVHYIALVLALSLCEGCSQFTSIHPPKDQMVTESVFSRDETAIAALMGLYNTISESKFSYLIPLYTGLSGDELETWSNLSTHQQMYKNALQPIDAASNQIWNLGYNMIYQSNAIIEGCEHSETLTPAIKEQLIGESLFLRAFCHFYLVNFFGDIPLLLSTNYEGNAELTRIQEAVVYEQIIRDLKEAEIRLSNDYLALNSLGFTSERIRPNKSSARAFMARVFLYTEDYPNAVLFATQVIDDKSKYDTVSLENVFVVGSKEAIWQLSIPAPSSNNYNTWEGAHFNLISRPMSNAFNSSTCSSFLLNAFEVEDQRKQEWIGIYADSSTESNDHFPFLYKYKILNATSIIERTNVLRLAEQYLIRAEARAQQNDFEGAIQDINVIRKRARLSLLDVSEIDSKEWLIGKIIHERRTELFGEWGHRWLDLKRSDRINEIMSEVSVSKGSTWDPSDALWPIPQQEIEKNKNLIQNIGYN